MRNRIQAKQNKDAALLNIKYLVFFPDWATWREPRGTQPSHCAISHKADIRLIRSPHFVRVLPHHCKHAVSCFGLTLVPTRPWNASSWNLCQAFEITLHLQKLELNKTHTCAVWGPEILHWQEYPLMLSELKWADQACCRKHPFPWILV